MNSNGESNYMEIKKQVTKEGKYIIYSDGKVFNVIRGAFLKPQDNPPSYYSVARVSGLPRQVSRLVADFFLPNPNNYKYIRHKDGDVFNNNVENLEWVSEFIYEKDICSKADNSGERLRKLTDEQVFRVISSPDSNRALAKEFGVSYSVIACIRQGKSYKPVLEKLRQQAVM